MEKHLKTYKCALKQQILSSQKCSGRRRKKRKPTHNGTKRHTQFGDNEWKMESGKRKSQKGCMCCGYGRECCCPPWGKLHRSHSSDVAWGGGGRDSDGAVLFSLVNKCHVSLGEREQPSHDHLGAFVYLIMQLVTLFFSPPSHFPPSIGKKKTCRFRAVQEEFSFLFQQVQCFLTTTMILHSSCPQRRFGMP
jgi:hypothetical protein